MDIIDSIIILQWYQHGLNYPFMGDNGMFHCTVTARLLEAGVSYMEW